MRFQMKTLESIMYNTLCIWINRGHKRTVLNAIFGERRNEDSKSGLVLTYSMSDDHARTWI